MSEREAKGQTTAFLYTLVGGGTVITAILLLIGFALDPAFVKLALVVADISLSVTFFALAHSVRAQLE